LETKATDLIVNVLKTKYVQPPKEDEQFNYIIDIGTQLYRNYFCFVSTCACPGPNAISPTFESKFARMEHLGNGKFALGIMCHTNEWFGLYDGLSVVRAVTRLHNGLLTGRTFFN